jgi:hypothetical protein
MGYFSKILDNLSIGGISCTEAATAPTPTTAPTHPAMASEATQPPTLVPLVDVVSQRVQSAAGNTWKLNLRTSIVDLLKLHDIDSSFTERKEFAKELGWPAELMGGIRPR